MSGQHTPEPWEVFDLYGDPEIREKNTGKLVSALRPERLKDARRIVACVNACAGISTERLEKFLGAEANRSVITLTTDNLDLKKQRDELLAALVKLADVFANIGTTSGLYDDEQDALQEACVAIYRAKGGAA